MKKTKHTKNNEVSNKTTSAHNTSAWMIAAIVLAVLFIATLVLGLTGVLSNDAQGMSQSSAEVKANEFVDALGMPITVSSVARDEGLYRIDITIEGQSESWYMSPTGELLFPSAFTLSDIEDIASGQAPTQQPPTTDVTVNLEDAHTLGDGEVLMVEYSSATCPFCARYATETFPLIKSDYVDTNQITYVYRHFIRNEVDVVAANAMECAGEQGVFFEYKELVYSNQNMLSQQTAYVQWAEQLDLDVDAFNTCVEAEKYTQLVTAQTQEGQNNGITGTPGFLVNARLIAGAQPFQNFQAAIEAELAN